MQRRELLKAAIAGMAGLSLAGVHRALRAGTDFGSQVAHPFLSSGQLESISALAELIIPETDTPGAISAGVPEFIELMLSDWYTADERQPFLDGLRELDELCGAEWGLAFAGCSIEQQTLALQQAEGSEFFSMARDLTVLGYYTSEMGASVELRYNPAPGAYNGDYDWSEGDRQFSG